MKIYIVMGTTGEYSDRSEWPVVAYQDEAMAQAHVLAATAEASRIQAALAATDSASRYTEEGRAQYLEIMKSSPYDPDLYIDYTGTSYYVMGAELQTALPVSLPHADEP